MEKIFNITNGDSTVTIMQQAKIPGDYFPWRDILHEGPVPAGLDLKQLSGVRAQYITERGWAELAEVQQSFSERDATLTAHGDYDKVLLWFEHDLYDQLQLLQLLDWFRQHLAEGTRLSLICVDQYLGTLTPQQMTTLAPLEQAVTPEQLELASQSWAAFRENTPMAFTEMLNKDTEALPFLHGAIQRMLQEYPSSSNGLSRTQQQALGAIAAGESRPARVFGDNQKQEQRMFMGDSSFWDLLRQMLCSNPPLLTLTGNDKLTLPVSPEQRLHITAAGKAVLSGESSWLDCHVPNHWFGGVHLTAENLWRWNDITSTMETTN
ncbi:MAG: hypothetical protein OEZ68_03120 [Gammaproteobacteria bacterium]|nr:hypothetical protein [Gammaproteobacteria bacterium]MDH5799774.1 hypothetical protein [Gammaproteobacteria bacterium]